MIFEDLFNDIFDALYGFHYSDGCILYKYEYSWECTDLEDQIKRFYIGVNKNILVTVEDIEKQILCWGYLIGGELNVDMIKLYDVSDKILEILKEKL